jgi:hypothetical protein
LETFLHVLRATDAATPLTASTVVRSTSGALVGAQFAQHVALFAENGGVAQDTYTVVGTGTLTHTIADLTPNVRYSITRNGATVTSAVASAKGVLQFTSLGGGTFSFAAAGAVAPPAAPTNLRIVQ